MERIDYCADFSKEILTLTRIGMDALGPMPKRSLYRNLVYGLISETLPVRHYPKLRSRLLEYVADNDLEHRFPISEPSYIVRVS